jgi:hypothetical protein
MFGSSFLNMPSDLYGPWEVEGYQVGIEFTGRARLVAERNGRRLQSIPAAIRESGDIAWMQVALEAAQQHQRDLRTLLENAMVEAISLSAEDLALLALDPAGRPMLEGLLLKIDGVVGRPQADDWLLETLSGDLYGLGAPATVVHPALLHAAGSLEGWSAWMNRATIRQPFKQIRRELYLPNADDLRTHTFSDRFSGERVRWDQARALLEGRGWHRVTKTSAERHFSRAGLTAHLEFRTPAARNWSNEDVVVNRVFFLPRGEYPVNRGNPGLAVEQVAPAVFSEALRDTGLICQVARRSEED